MYISTPSFVVTLLLLLLLCIGVDGTADTAQQHQQPVRMSKTDALPGVTKGNQLTLEILPADDGPLYMLSDLSRKPSHLEAELSSAPRFEESANLATVTERKYSTSAVRFKQSNSNNGARLRHGRRRHTSRNSH
ncbi:unnamed protein product [Vitrella brassicaformis CCMP3155]|uniref:Secreted protein n=1 Tax=Vitrella brassicaformis (strain CCMP3155) TaxID=1169540 RepID=A0A0G4G1R6_VITBC|nr:unnamed protein product [Vitrella brassicaformis CCMP3155]|eukprot:CEM21997.1 unnamed protein product [Vitrella brassicaformis CCMP3155]